MNNKNTVMILHYIDILYDYEIDTHYRVEVSLFFNEYGELIRVEMILI